MVVGTSTEQLPLPQRGCIFVGTIQFVHVSLFASGERSDCGRQQALSCRDWGSNLVANSGGKSPQAAVYARVHGIHRVSHPHAANDRHRLKKRRGARVREGGRGGGDMER